MYLEFLKYLLEEGRFSKIPYIFNICHIGSILGLEPLTLDDEFHNFARGLHRHHNHVFPHMCESRENMAFCIFGSVNENEISLIQFQYRLNFSNIILTQ